MAVHFFDTSALVKAYVQEVGTAWVLGIVDPAAENDIYISRLTVVEMTSAIIRRRNSGSISNAKAAVMLADFQRDVASEFLVVDVTEPLLIQAAVLVEHYGLKAYDAVQLASCLEINSRQNDLALPNMSLLSADQELNAAAVLKGVIVDNPNDQH